MSDSDDATVAALGTPLGKAFVRLFEDEGFVAEVIESTDRVGAEYGLDAEDKAALLSDAHALEGEVAGFGLRAFGGRFPVDFAGLRSPIRLGIQSPPLIGTITFAT